MFTHHDSECYPVFPLAMYCNEVYRSYVSLKEIFRSSSEMDVVVEQEDKRPPQGHLTVDGGQSTWVAGSLCAPVLPFYLYLSTRPLCLSTTL